VPSRQRNELSAPIIKKWIGCNQERVDVLLINGSESGFEVAFGAGIEYTNLAPERVHCRLKFCQLRLRDRVIQICKHSDDGGSGSQFKQKLQTFCHCLAGNQRYARDVAARPIEAGDEPKHDGVAANYEDNRNGRGRCLCGTDRGSAGSCDDNGHSLIH
jgi:hypothetical protein